MKGQTRDPNTLRSQCLENSSRCHLATIANYCPVCCDCCDCGCCDFWARGKDGYVIWHHYRALEVSIRGLPKD